MFSFLTICIDNRSHQQTNEASKETQHPSPHSNIFLCSAKGNCIFLKVTTTSSRGCRGKTERGGGVMRRTMMMMMMVMTRRRRRPRVQLVSGWREAVKSRTVPRVRHEFKYSLHDYCTL